MGEIQIEIRDAAGKLVELVQRARDGEEVILVVDGEPVARIAPLPKKARRVFGSAKGQIIISPDFDDPLADFRDYQ
jgi:prevent-host-death family protein